MNQKTKQTITISGFFKKRKYSILFPFILIFSAAALFSVLRPNTFVSTSTLLIEGRHGGEDYNSVQSSGVEMTIENITRQMMKSDTIESFINQYHLYEDELSGVRGAALLEKREDLIRRVRKDIRISLLTTDLIHSQKGQKGAPAVGLTISFKGANPDKVHEMAKALTDFFLEKSESEKSGGEEKTVSMIDREIKAQRTRADDIEKRLAAFRERHKDFLPEKKATNYQALRDINTRIVTIDEAILKNGGAGETSGSEGRSNSRIDQLKNEKKELLKKQDEFREKIEQASLIETEYHILLKDYENEKKIYHNLTEMGLESGTIVMEKQDLRPFFTVIEPAGLPSKPDNLFRMLILIAGFGVGCLTGILSGLFREWTDDTVWTENELKALSDKPVLAVISKIGGQEGHLPKKEGLMFSAEDIKYNQSKVCEVNAGTMKQNKLLSHFYGTIPSEEYNILKTRLLTKTRTNNHNTILVTSAEKGEGKSLTAANLALSLAKELANTVLLVDADLKEPSIHKLFNLEPSSGLSEYFLMNIPLGNLFINPGVNKLLILPGNHRIENSTELIGAPKMAQLIQELKMRYTDRYVIIDSASLNEYADAMILSNYVDGVILVVEARKTKKSEIQKAIAALEDHNLIGLVLNKG